MKRVLLIFAGLLSAGVIMAQTNIMPYDLRKGNFFFGRWDSSSQARTYPPHMLFQWVDRLHTAPFYEEGSKNYDCVYFTMPNSRIGGLDYNGICFASTGTSQNVDCGLEKASDRFLGCAVLALSSSGRKSIKVTWTAGTLKQSEDIPWKECRLRLQYRTGSSGNFRDLPDNIEYIASRNPDDSLTLGPITLPKECDNKSLLQLRWIFFESSKFKPGVRPKLRLDDIKISSSAISENIIKLSENDPFPITINTEIVTIDLNNYYSQDEFEILLTTSLGITVFSRFSTEQFIRLNIRKLVKGMCILSLRNCSTDHVIYKNLYVE